MKLLCLLSGGIDSPVAAYSMLKKGYDVDFVYFDNSPYSDAATLKKAKELATKLKGLLHNGKRKRFAEDRTPVLSIEKQGQKLKRIVELQSSLTCVLCKRSMLRSAEKLAKKLKCDALLTGDNLAQVASQTLDNLQVETTAVDLPIIRPLIGFNKQEIVDLAKEIGTYDISIQKAKPCGAVPSKPATHADLNAVLEAEKQVGA